MIIEWLKSFEHVPPAAIRHVLRGFIWEGTPDSGAMAVTFDDGPDPEVTPAVLDVLDEMGARGTFFMIGEKVSENPSLARIVAGRGHQLGNHSMTHPRMLLMKRAEVECEIDMAQKTIADATGIEPRMFRPPYGICDFTCANAVRDREMDMVMWTVLSGDYSRDSDETVFRRVERFIRPGAIVVFHDTKAGGGFGLCEILRKTGTLAKERQIRLGALEELSIFDDMNIDGKTDG